MVDRVTERLGGIIDDLSQAARTVKLGEPVGMGGLVVFIDCNELVVSPSESHANTHPKIPKSLCQFPTTGHQRESNIVKTSLPLEVMVCLSFPIVHLEERTDAWLDGM